MARSVWRIWRIRLPSDQGGLSRTEIDSHHDHQNYDDHHDLHNPDHDDDAQVEGTMPAKLAACLPSASYQPSQPYIGGYGRLFDVHDDHDDHDDGGGDGGVVIIMLMPL